MRISDWSQTCALPICVDHRIDAAGGAELVGPVHRHEDAARPLRQSDLGPHDDPAMGAFDHRQPARRDTAGGGIVGMQLDEGLGDMSHQARSEEHTSELQSLMRTSSAVFCLKKKKTN